MASRLPRAFSTIQARRTSKKALSSLAIVVALLSPASALQVSPNSACASICMDNPSSDASDPNSSNTYGFDIVCKDSDYSNTPVGSKFESCIDCLQGSSASATNENDQGWFFYNLRYAFNSCIYGTTNATDSFSTPCSSSSTCGPIQKALGDGMGTPMTTGQYSYCTAYGNSFLGGGLDVCRDCLKANNEASYLSNFLTGLQAGCTQRPANNMVIGLNSTLFTKNKVTITYPQLAAGAKKSKGIAATTIIGIAIGCGILAIILLALLIVCIKKRRNERRLKQLRSPLHERFGAENITAPNSGAFSSPQTSPPLKKESVQMTVAPQVRNFSYSRQQNQRAGEWQGSAMGDSPASSSDPPCYSAPIPAAPRDSLPAHHAYIPPEYTPSSRNSTSPLFIPSPPPSQAPQPVPSSHPHRAPSQSGMGRSNLPTPPHPRLQRNRSESSGPAVSPPITTRQNSGATRLQTSTLGARRGLAPGPVVTGVPPIETPEAKNARERRYRQGLGGTRAHGPESPVPERPSPESEAGSEEMWPGSY